MRLRDWLQINKVFFEVFASIFLGAMAVLVSIAALSVSKLQATLADAQVSPHIRVSTEYIYDKEASKYTDQTFRVFNDGFALREFDASVKSLLKVSVDRGGTKREILIPTVYVVIGFQTDNSTGLLFTFTQKGNNSQMTRLENEIRAANKPDGTEYYGLNLLNLLITSYIDAVGRKQHRNFLVGGAAGGLEISDGEASKLMEAYSSKSSRNRHVADLKGADLLLQLEASTK